MAYDCISDESSLKLTLDSFSAETGVEEKKLVAVGPLSDSSTGRAGEKNVSVSRCNALALCGMVSWKVIKFVKPDADVYGGAG
jgi:hypothetical protein